MVNQAGQSLLQIAAKRLAKVFLLLQRQQSIADSINSFDQTLPFLCFPGQSLFDAAQHCPGCRFNITLIDITDCDRNSEDFARS